MVFFFFATVSNLSSPLGKYFVCVFLLPRSCPMMFEEMCARSMRGRAAAFTPACALTI